MSVLRLNEMFLEAVEQQMCHKILLRLHNGALCCGWHECMRDHVATPLVDPSILYGHVQYIQLAIVTCAAVSISGCSLRVHKAGLPIAFNVSDLI